MSGSNNKLSIRTQGLQLDLEGESASVQRAYATLRTQLIEQFYQTMLGTLSHRDPTHELERVDASDDAQQDSAAEQVENPPEHFVGLVICEDIYHKMYLLDERRFHQSFLSRVLRGEQIRRIYVNADMEAKLRESVQLGNTLWRELTRAGKAAVARSE